MKNALGSVHASQPQVSSIPFACSRPHAQVDQFGAMVPLKSVSQVSVPDASTLLVSPFDRAALKDIEKALQESDIGINPSNDGEKIRLNIPQLTQDRRKELAKQVAKFAEEGKV